MWWRNEQELLYPSQEQQENKWAEWLGRGEREGDKGPKAFCPGWRYQPGQNGGLLSRLVAPTGTTLLSRLEPPTEIKGPPFLPVGVSNRDKTPWPPDPLPSPPSRAIQVTCSCCSWLGRGESCSFLHHICENLWFPVHPSTLKVRGLFFSSSLACIAHFML